MDEGKARGELMQIERLRAASPGERLEAAAAQRRIALELLRGGVRARFPHLTEEEVENKVGEAVFGVEAWRDICERRRRRSDGARPA